MITELLLSKINHFEWIMFMVVAKFEGWAWNISCKSWRWHENSEKLCSKVGPPFPSHTDGAWQCIWWGQLSYTPRYKWTQIAAILWQLNLVINTGGDIYRSHKNLTFRHHNQPRSQLSPADLPPASHATSRCQRPGHFIIQSWLQTFT